MLNFVYIADIGEGLFWIIVAIASIAGQIAKASKRSKMKQGGFDAGTHPDSGQKAAEATSPEDQLREFLRSLTGQPPPPKSHPVQTAPALVPQRPRPAAGKPVQQQKTPQTHFAPHKKHQRRETPRPVDATSTTTLPRTSRKRAAVQTVAPAVAMQPHQTRQQSSASATAQRISSQSPLRAAILWREILGPPVALKQAGKNT